MGSNKRTRSLRTIAALVLVAGLLASVLSGCGKQPAAQTTGGADKVVKLNFYFPIDAAGPLAKLMSDMTADFNKSHPDISVTPVYAGSYNETQAKAVAAYKAGTPPDVAVLLSTALYQLKDLDVIQPLDSYVSGDSDGQAYMSDFFPGLLMNAKDGNTLWSIPFQRSTPVLYYNKDAFTKAGLDPNQPPKTWDELVADAKKLTVKDSNGNVTQWGIEVPTYYWDIQGLILESGGDLANADGTKVNFNSPTTIDVLKWLVGLQQQGVMPKAAMPWANMSADFTSGRAAMIFHSTGSLVGFKSGTNFGLGVAFMPANKSYGVPTGGGDLYMFKGIPADHQKAAWTFIRWMTDPAQAARWSIGSGYIAVRQSAWDLPEMKDYVAKTPEAVVGRDQLQYASKEFATHQLTQLWKIMDDNFSAVMTGTMTPEAAMQKAQQQADTELQPFQK